MPIRHVHAKALSKIILLIDFKPGKVLTLDVPSGTLIRVFHVEHMFPIATLCTLSPCRDVLLHEAVG